MTEMSMIQTNNCINARCKFQRERLQILTISSPSLNHVKSSCVCFSNISLSGHIPEGIIQQLLFKRVIARLETKMLSGLIVEYMVEEHW